MQRRKAITTAATISLALFSAATAMAVNTGLLLSPPTEGVGQLNAVTADALGPAPTTVPPAPPQTIIVTVPRSAVSGAVPAATAPLRPAPPTLPSPTVAIAPASRATTSTTVRTSGTSTTVRGEDDDDEHDDDEHEDEDEDEDDHPTTSTSRPSGGEDDD